MKEGKQHPVFPNLNGLRTFGALVVLIYHAFYLNRLIWGDFFDSWFFKKAEIVVNRGHFAIELFFIISGFLITYLMLHEQKAKGRISVKNFLARRFLRVWPLYFLVVLFGFFIFPHLPYGKETVHEFWLFAVFLSNYSEIIYGAKDSINFLSATWTVSVEEQFYLVWAFIFGLLSIRNPRLLGTFFIIIVLASLLFRYVNLSNQRVLDLHLLSVMSDLAIGGLCAITAFNGSAKNLFSKISRPGIVSAYIAGLTLILFEDHIFTGNMVVFGRVIPGIFFAFVVLEQVFSERSFYKADAIPAFHFIGKHTYAIYMLHCIVIYYTGIVFSTLGLTQYTLHFVIYLVVVLSLTWILARMSFLLFERPFLNLQRFFRD